MPRYTLLDRTRTNTPSTLLSAPYSPGDGILYVVDASVFGTPTPEAPIRLTTVMNAIPQSVLKCVGFDTDENTLTIDGAIDGYTDVALPALTTVRNHLTAAYITDLYAEMDAITGDGGGLDSKANDDEVVHLAGTETVTGNKTFSGTSAFTGTSLGFFGTSPVTKPTGSILSGLSSLGLVGTPSIPIGDISSALSGGNTGSQTWALSSDSGGTGRLDSTSNATKGNLNLNGVACSVLPNGSISQTITDSIASSPQKTCYSATCNYSTSTGVSNNGNGGISSVVNYTVTGSAIASRTAVGINSALTYAAGSSVAWSSGNFMGFRSVVVNGSNQTLGFAHGLEAGVGTTNVSGTTTNARGVYTSIIKTGTVTNGVGVYCDSPTGAGTVTNLYGLYVGPMDAGATTNFSIFTNSGQARFGDSVAIGGTGSFGGGTGGVIFLKNCLTPPTVAPTDGVVLFAQGGRLKAIDVDAVVTPLTPVP